MAYILSGLVYLAAALGLVFLSYRYVEGYLNRDLGLWLRGMLVLLCFAPWYVQGAEGLALAPALIAVLFNVLAKDWAEALLALLPILALAILFTASLLIIRRGQPTGRSSG